jgi:hypothetical protein
MLASLDPPSPGRVAPRLRDQYVTTKPIPPGMTPATISSIAANNAFICGGSNLVVAIALCWTVVLCAIVQTGDTT